MGKNLLKIAYNNTPSFFKKGVARIPFSWRMGKTYRETLGFLEASQWQTAEDLSRYSFEKLKELLVYAGETVPYYRRLFKEISFSPEKMANPADISNLPLLSKKDVFQSFDALKSEEYTFLNSYEGMTGGTTGEPLKLLFSVKSNSYEWAFLHALWQRAGFDPSMKRAALMGAPFRESSEGKKRVAVDYFHHQLQLSPQDLDSESVAVYARELAAFSPDFIYGLPSAIALLVKYLKEMDVTLPHIRGILCGSENIYPAQRERMEEFFQAKVFSWYGQTEKVVLGGECEISSEYHVFSEYGHTEIVNSKGNPIHDPGIPGEIVGTGYINRAMPLIRYRTGDMGEWSEGDCPCGRKYKRIRKIVGRRDPDVLIGNKDDAIPLTALDMQGLTFGKVFQLQFEQHEKGVADLFVMSDYRLDDTDLETIKDELESQVGRRIRFCVKTAETLTKTASGKVKPCIQHVKEGVF